MNPKRRTELAALFETSYTGVLDFFVDGWQSGRYTAVKEEIQDKKGGGKEVVEVYKATFDGGRLTQFWMHGDLVVQVQPDQQLALV